MGVLENLGRALGCGVLFACMPAERLQVHVLEHAQRFRVGRCSVDGRQRGHRRYAVADAVLGRLRIARGGPRSELQVEPAYMVGVHFVSTHIVWVQAFDLRDRAQRDTHGTDGRVAWCSSRLSCFWCFAFAFACSLA